MGKLLGIFESIFENLGVVSTPLKYFQMVLETCRWTWELKELDVL
jgi:hypothetical protein